MPNKFLSALVSVDEVGDVALALVGRRFLIEASCSRETALALCNEIFRVVRSMPNPVART